MGDWSQLPKELLDVIATNLDSSIDITRLRAVCPAWRAALSPPSYGNLPFCDFPKEIFFRSGGGYFLSKRTIFRLTGPRNPHSYYYRTMAPNSGSWLIKIEQDRSGSCRPFSPISGAEIKPSSLGLPRTIDLLNVRVHELGAEYVLRKGNRSLCGIDKKFPIKKLVYLQESNGNYLLLAKLNNKLVMYSSCEAKWDVIDRSGFGYDDLIALDGKFYAVKNNGWRTICIERVGLSNVVTTVAEQVYGLGYKSSLVSVGKDLMLVSRYRDCLPVGILGESSSGDSDDDMDYSRNWETRGLWFHVHKLDEKECKWVKLQSLGDHIIFFGDDHTFSATPSELGISEGNRIFFNYSEHYCTITEYAGGIGFYDLEDDACTTDYSCELLFWPPPLWIESDS